MEFTLAYLKQDLVHVYRLSFFYFTSYKARHKAEEVNILWVVKTISLGWLLEESIQYVDTEKQCPIRPLIQYPEHLNHPVNHAGSSLRGQVVSLAVYRNLELILQLCHPDFFLLFMLLRWLWPQTVPLLRLDLKLLLLRKCRSFSQGLLFDVLEYLFTYNHGLTLTILLGNVYVSNLAQSPLALLYLWVFILTALCPTRTNSIIDRLYSDTSAFWHLPFWSWYLQIFLFFLILRFLIVYIRDPRL